MQSLPKTTCGIAVLLALAVVCGCDRGSSTDMVGKSAPDFTVQDSDRTVSLHELHGKVIVLNFWATWCPPCVQEMPSLVAMQSQLKDRVNVLAVSVDQNPETYHRFLRLYGVNLLTVRDPEQKSNTLYGTKMFPETYIIDTRGIIRRKFIEPVDWTRPEILQYLQQL